MRRKSLIRLTIPAIALALAASVAAPAHADPTDPSDPAVPATEGAEAAGNLIALVDQGADGNGATGQKILFMKEDADWSSPAAVAWTLNIPSGWNGIADVKTRVDGQGRKLVLVAAGNGRVGSFLYHPGEGDDGKLIWSGTVKNAQGCNGKHNPHAIELIPDAHGGGYAVADTAGYVWRFPAGKSTTSDCERLATAHGVLYSDGRLWAVGHNGLVQYDITAKGLKKFGAMMTTGGFVDGHDLSPVYGDAKHRMWVSDRFRVYRFDKYAGGPRPKPVRVTGILTGQRVKSVGNQLDGTVVETRPFADTDDCPKSFQTRTVWVFTQNGTVLVKKKLPSSCVYKARPVIWGYY